MKLFQCVIPSVALAIGVVTLTAGPILPTLLHAQEAELIHLSFEGDDSERVAQLVDTVIKNGREEGVLFALVPNDSVKPALRIVLLTGRSFMEVRSGPFVNTGLGPFVNTGYRAFFNTFSGVERRSIRRRDLHELVTVQPPPAPKPHVPTHPTLLRSVIGR